ncbi:MAG: YhbY family RNA-binding protein [Thermodesulfobacteriota bacterium]
MAELKASQRKYLRAKAHAMKPAVYLGQKGLSPSVFDAIDGALDAHELIKLKFVDFKEKHEKTALAEAIEEELNTEMVGMIGHVAIFYRRHKDPEKRRIDLPQ